MSYFLCDECIVKHGPFGGVLICRPPRPEVRSFLAFVKGGCAYYASRRSPLQKMSTPVHAPQLQVFVYLEDGLLVGQCLEYDVAVQGRDLSQVVKRFILTLLGHVARDVEAGRKPLENVPHAPPRVKERYHRARWVLPTEQRLQLDLPEEVMRRVPPSWLLAAMNPELRQE